MKTTFIFLTFCFLSLLAKADCYTNYELKITIETIDGKTHMGYANVSSCYFKIDSLENAEYVKTRLIQDSKNFVWEKPRTEEIFWYFQDRLEYEYRIWDEYKDLNTLYYLLNPNSIPEKDIKSIKIDSLIYKSAFMLITNGLQLQDSVWMKKEPIKRIGIGGYLCGHRVFIHISSKEIDNIVEEIEMKAKEIEKIDIDETNGDAIDKEVWEIVKKLNGQKVVIVSECSD